MKKAIVLTVLALICVSASAFVNKARWISFKSWDNYEITSERVGSQGTKFVKVWGYGITKDKAIMAAKMNAVHAALFRGIPANPAAGVHVATPAIIGSIDIAERNNEYFQDFFGAGGPYLRYINVTSDGIPAGQDCRKVRGGYKVAIYVQVMYDNLKKQMQADGFAQSLDFLF